MLIIIPVIKLPINDIVKNGSIEKLSGQFIKALNNDLKIAVDINPKANNENGKSQ